MDQKDMDRIKAAIDAHHDWPALYLFKFIVPSDNEKIARVESLFNSKTAEIRLKQSNKGNYTSISAREVMLNADAVMDTYRRAAAIEGVIAL